MGSAEDARRALKRFADPKRAENSLWFFKTAKGEYGEGDKFIGASVPNVRKVARQFKDLAAEEILKLLHNPVHEYRQLALFIINRQFEKGDEATRKFWFDKYLKNISYVNGWDLVDGSAHIVIGGWLLERDRSVLYKLARRPDLWSRRAAIIATFRFIKEEDYADTLEVAKILLNDDEDLIHKAVGWMLREIGNRDRKVLIDFLKPRYKDMPRTMLRYAIEKLPEDMRQDFLKGRV